MGSYLSLPLLILAVAIQSGMAPQLRILGGAPDLVFLFVLAWSVHARLEEGVTWALVGGILEDLLSVTPVGTSSIGLIIMVFVINQLSAQVYTISFLLLAVFTVAGTLFQQVINYILLFLAGGQIDMLADLSYVIIPTIVYNFIFIWPVYWFLRWFQRRFASNRRITLQ